MPDIILRGNYKIGGSEQPPIFTGSHPEWGDEFVLPSDYTDFRSEYNIIGNTVDITSALQDALNNIGEPGYSSYLYIASSGVPTVYEISSNILIKGKQYVYPICEHPEMVTFRWTGGDDGIMFTVDGVAYSSLFHRCTMESINQRTIYVRQGWKTTGTGEGRVFDTGNSYLDIVFKDGAQALQLGFDATGKGLGEGAAETLIDRCRFYRFTAPNDWANGKGGGAIITGNYNALDTWPRNCYFEDCEQGVSNDYGAGNFHLSKCIFKDCSFDIRVQNVEQFSARECFSNNPKSFFYAGNTSNSAQVILQKNTIIDAENQVNGWASVYNINQGPLLGMDNKFKLFPSTNDAPDGQGFQQYDGSFAYGSIGGEITSIGDTTTKLKSNPRWSVFQLSDNSKFSQYRINVVSRSAINSTAPLLYPFQIKRTREVFTVPLGSSTDEVNNILISANTFNGSRPIVLFEEGTYTVDLVIPKGDIQLQGNKTRINGTLSAVGPTKFTSRDIEYRSINISNVNQVGSRVYFEELQFFFNHTKGLELTNLNVPVIFTNSGFAYGNATAVKVNGGMATHLFYGCQGMHEATQFDVTDGKIQIAAYWAEKTSTDPFIHAKGNSEVTFNGGRIATAHYQAGVMEDPIILVEGNNNKFTSLGLNLNNYIKVTGNNNQVLAMSNLLTSPYIINEGSNNDVRGIMNLKRTSGNAGETLEDIGVADETFIINMISTARGIQVPQLTPTPDNTSDIRFFRTRIQSTETGLIITG